jgi:photosystem II stability/assembly factor-like uncharacterized protein
MRTILISLVFILTGVNIVSAQWTQTNGPQGADIQYIITNSGNILYAASYTHVYRSYNNGNYWELLNPPTTSTAQIFAKDSYLYMLNGNGGLFRSDDEGDTWSSVSELGNKLINSIAFYQDSVYISINQGIFVSNNNGITFDYFPVATDFSLYDELIFAGNYLFTSSLHSAVYSVLRSSDFGRSWIRIDSSGVPEGKYARHYAFANNTLFGSFIYSGIYKSTDLGVHWSQVLSEPDDYYAVLKY